MPISDIPILSMLRTRMHWHQDRQHLLAENVANSDTPKFRPRDLRELKFDGPGTPGALTLAQTNVAHVAPAGQTSFQTMRANHIETRPGGNSVNVEDEMLKVAQNQMEYQAASALYTRSLGLIKTALGKR
jgi:flagellar basal-body rod protein FlgB